MKKSMPEKIFLGVVFFLILALLGASCETKVEEPTLDEMNTVVQDIIIIKNEELFASKRPFLWGIEGDKPSYIFGTIHLGDERILTLPDVVIERIQIQLRVLIPQ